MLCVGETGGSQTSGLMNGLYDRQTDRQTISLNPFGRLTREISKDVLCDMILFCYSSSFLPPAPWFD